MDDSYPSYPPSHLLIAPLGVDCKFAVVTIKNCAFSALTLSALKTRKETVVEPLEVKTDFGQADHMEVR